MTTAFDSIGHGDMVEIFDGANYLRGPAKLINGTVLGVQAFGGIIPFARRNSAHRWTAVPGVKLVAHQPPLDLEAWV